MSGRAGEGDNSSPDSGHQAGAGEPDLTSAMFLDPTILSKFLHPAYNLDGVQLDPSDELSFAHQAMEGEMDDDDQISEDGQHFPLGGIAEDILAQISEQIEQEAPPEVIEAMKEKVRELEGPQLSAFILGKMFGQMAISEDEPRLFYASVACLWFSSVFNDQFEVNSIQELMILAERCWEDAQESISEVISRSVDKLIEEI